MTTRGGSGAENAPTDSPPHSHPASANARRGAEGIIFRVVLFIHPVRPAVPVGHHAQTSQVKCVIQRGSCDAKNVQNPTGQCWGCVHTCVVFIFAVSEGCLSGLQCALDNMVSVLGAETPYSVAGDGEDADCSYLWYISKPEPRLPLWRMGTCSCRSDLSSVTMELKLQLWLLINPGLNWWVDWLVNRLNFDQEQ